MGLVKTIYNVLGVFTVSIIACFERIMCPNFMKKRRDFCLNLTCVFSDNSKINEKLYK